MNSEQKTNIIFSCFDTDGWVSGRQSNSNKNLTPKIPKEFLRQNPGNEQLPFILTYKSFPRISRPPLKIE